MNAENIVDKLAKLDINNNEIITSWRKEILDREINEKNLSKTHHRESVRGSSAGHRSELSWRNEIREREALSFGAGFNRNKSGSNSNLPNEGKTRWKSSNRSSNPNIRSTLRDSHSRDKSLIFNEQFEIVFDLPTPRPHLIIKFKENNKTKCTLADLNKQQIKKIFELVENFLDNFNVTEQVVLSFHTGYWLSKPKFHAHLCISIGTYVRILNEVNPYLESFRPTSNWTIKSPDSNYKTMKDVYIKNVIDYKKQALEASLKYKQSELELIRTKSHSNSTNCVPEINNQFELSFDFSEPKLKFSAKRQTKEVADSLDFKTNMLEEMCQFALNKGFFSKESGCHICMNLNTSENSSGFLRVGADSYFCMHPFPEIFLKNFESLDNYLIQT